jgi:hypothetical protein
LRSCAIAELMFASYWPGTAYYVGLQTEGNVLLSPRLAPKGGQDIPLTVRLARWR